MEKLFYNKYKGSNDILTIDLHNGYTIIAIKGWNYDNRVYDIEFRIKDNNLENWDVIEESITFENAEPKTINSAILKWVGTNLENGYFDEYVQRVKYYNDCFERGNEMFEKEYLCNNEKEE